MTNTAEKKPAAADIDPAPDAELGADTVTEQNRIDMNDPSLTEEEAVAKNLGQSADEA